MELIDYFLNERSSIKYFIVNHHQVKIDSLLPTLKNSIDEVKYWNDWEDRSDNNPLKKGKYKEIYQTITHDLNTGGFASKIHLNNIQNSINILPDCKEKVQLRMKYEDLVFQNTNNYVEMDSICDTLIDLVENISGMKERAEAYRYVGDFAAYYEINDFAIEMYYKAQDIFTTENNNVPNNEIGITFNKIAQVFSDNESDIGIYASAIHYQNATEAFRKIGNITDGNISHFCSIANIAYLLYKYPSSIYYSDLTRETIKNLWILKKHFLKVGEGDESFILPEK